MSQEDFSGTFFPYNLNLFSKEIDSKRMVIQQTLLDYYLAYFRDIEKTLEKIDLHMFNRINELLYNAFWEGNQIFTMGNGGSGTTASHIVCDLNKGVDFTQNKKFKAICLNDNLPIVLAYANDLSYANVFSEQLKNFMEKGDIVIAFSGSGNSENITRAVEYANANGGIAVGFSGFDGGKLSEMAKFPLVVPVNDMQKSEDIHMILSHIIMKTMNLLLRMKPNE